jgi:hypothetical protein
VLASNHQVTPTQPETAVPSNTDKENAALRPPVPTFTNTISRPQSPSSPLPPDLYTLYHSSRRTLEASFARNPPYTIQRLAELVLHPKTYYRHLPPYLAALDRVVSVTSPVNDFPLAQAAITDSSTSTTTTSFLANGSPADSLGDRENLGSDESLGGALLTPIPWLKRENGHIHDFRSESSQTIEGPNGAGVIETVSVSSNGSGTPNSSESDDQHQETIMSHEQALRAEGGVTQGELLRQEQEAGIVPVGQEVPRRPLMAGGSASAVGRSNDVISVSSAANNHVSSLQQQSSNTTPTVEELHKQPEEHAHARGPEEIGAEDMGPQDSALFGATRPLDMEAAAGRHRSPPASAAAVSSTDDKIVSLDAAMSDGDDVVAKDPTASSSLVVATVETGEEKEEEEEEGETALTNEQEINQGTEEQKETDAAAVATDKQQPQDEETTKSDDGGDDEEMTDV